MPKTHIFCVRYVLECTAPLHLPPSHGHTLRGLLGAAVGPVKDTLLARVLPRVYAHGAVRFSAGACYSFGVTMFRDDTAAAAAVLHALNDGLARVGEQAARPGACFGANFRVGKVVDLITAHCLAGHAEPAPLAPNFVAGQVERLRARDTLTLEFTSPLRAQREAAARSLGGEFFDAAHFPAGLFLARTIGRQRELALSLATPVDVRPDDLVLLENNLEWQNTAYLGDGKQMTTSGAIGRVRLRYTNPAVLGPLVLGQYCGVGERTSDGHGVYHIAELGVGLW